VHLAVGSIFLGVYYFNRKGEVVFVSDSRKHKDPTPVQAEWPK
jgi:hypothetical protein